MRHHHLPVSVAVAMIFNSLVFLVFFPVVFVGNVALARTANLRKLFLLVASYFFYAQWDPRFLILIWVSTAVDWFVGGALGSATGQRKRRLLLAVSLVVNIGLLGTFKYLNFFIESAGALLEAIGFQPNLPVLQLILPVGISFYTFQTMSYTLDIYFGKLKPQKSALEFALFVAFFPQLVAGPIVRARDLLPQLAANPMPTRKDLSAGTYDILSGLLKKVLIADVLGAQLATPFYENPEQYGFFGALTGIYGFAFQIFGDFAGYSQIAIGCSRLLGYELPTNFNNPFMSRNNLEIWRRWHITLLTWMRDYLYIPLGGSKLGERKTYRNIMITNLFAGVWHGAGINFIIWGIVNGVTICCSRLYQLGRGKRGKKDSPDDPLVKIWWQRAVTFHVWILAMPLFRTDTLADVAEVGRAIFRLESPYGPTPDVPLRGVLLLVLAVAMMSWSEYYGRGIRNTWNRLLPEAQGVIFLVAIGAFGLLSVEATPFIYFQF
jgi:D-alanyl-lipoteichoic acid acyltransferase DltB (MBOAT superfamily)